MRKILKGQQMGNSVSVPLKAFGIEAGKSYLVKETIDGVVITKADDERNETMQKIINGIIFNCTPTYGGRFIVSYKADDEVKISIKSTVEEVDEFITEKSKELAEKRELYERATKINKAVVESGRSALLKNGWES